MEVFRTEVHNLLIRPFLDDAVDALGAERVESMVGEWGVSVAELSDPDAWLSLEFVEAFFERLDAVRTDPTLFQRCARMVVAPKYAGFLRPLFRAFGSPAFAFAQVAGATGRFNKIGRMELVSSTSESATLAYHPIPGAPRESTLLVCRARAANLEALPMMFDLPPAELHHPQCLHRGDPECRYELRWRHPRRSSRLLVAAAGTLAGAAVTWWLASASDAQGAMTAVGGFLGAVLFGAVAYTWNLRGRLADRMQDISDQQDALTRSAQAHERRFAELVDAKHDVDRQVEERTAEVRWARDQLAEALSQLESASSAKTLFFENVSHELRTPLTLILAPLEDLVSGREPPGGRAKALDSMQRNATRLLNLINQLLDLAKIDAEAMRATRAPTDAVQLVRDVVASFASVAEKSEKQLTVTVPAQLAPSSLDAGWVESAVTNLVANALRHARTKVHVRLLDRGDELRIEVEDDGPGMAPADLERVFERFAQGRASEAHGGTGLGLAIVREAARLHGGDASARSEEGSGTTFTISLPRAFPGEEAPTQRPETPSSTRPLPLVLPDSPPSADRPGPAADAPLALVVEDNDDLRGYIADVLGARYRVRTASDGRTGLELALELRPQVIVSDVAMPELDGFGMTRELRTREETRGTPVILVTARRSVSSVLEGFEAGADDYVSKPFHGRELLARVDAHVRLRQLVREMAHRERLATLGVVAASVAHQVRNPLTVLMSGLPSVQRRLADRVDPATAEMFEVMGGCARRIERMTVDLLDLSRIDREEQGVFRPGEGLASAVRLVAAGVPSGVQVETDIDSTAAMRGRAGDLNHVFLNLVDNACRAVGDEGTVRVGGALEGAEYVVRVEDTGPGVPEDRRARIFEPFFTTRGAGEGTGLGLSIAKQVVHQHGGRIELDTSALGGARFTVRLPGASSDNCVVPYDARSLPRAHRP